MPVPIAPLEWRSELSEPPSNPIDLLMEPVTDAGWEFGLGKKRIFLIHGIKWFRSAVLGKKLSVSDAAMYIKDMKQRLSLREDWTNLSFDWTAPFSPRQFIDAASPAKLVPLQFDKAVQVLLLCEVIADELHKNYQGTLVGNDVYRSMAILPACFYIHDFDREALRRASEAVPQLLTKLREATRQRSTQVFRDMAEGKTVTKWLAEATRAALINEAPDLELGSVDFRVRKNVTFRASEYEEICISQI